jgi:hypothetical protein
MLWSVGFLGACLVEFGLVYILCTLPVVMFRCTREQKEEGELSAYSHFNQGGFALPGTTTAAHFEDHMMHRDTRNKYEEKTKPHKELKNHYARASKSANQPCVCGSGKKYKRCCSLNSKPNPRQEAEFQKWEKEWT